jgi:hypothetical protein
MTRKDPSQLICPQRSHPRLPIEVAKERARERQRQKRARRKAEKAAKQSDYFYPYKETLANHSPSVHNGDLNTLLESDPPNLYPTRDLRSHNTSQDQLSVHPCQIPISSLIDPILSPSVDCIDRGPSHPCSSDLGLSPHPTETIRYLNSPSNEYESALD